MIRHIVCWNFRENAEGGSKGENLRKAREMLLALTGVIPEIRSLEVGIDVVRGEHSWDMALVGTFASRADLVAYQQHPAHQAVLPFLRAVWSERCSVDYEVSPP